MDVSAVKLFVSNRNGAEPLDVVLRDLTIHADRINGLGTVVRTVYDKVFYGDPTSIEKGLLILGASAAPAPGNPNQPVMPVQGEVVPTRTVRVRAARAGMVVVVAPAANQVMMAPAAPAAAPVPAAAPAPAQVVAAPGPAPAAGTASAPAASGDPFAPDALLRLSLPPQKPRLHRNPRRRIPLDEVESIRFERTPSMSARFMGQPNLDFTMPGLSAKKDEASPKDVATPKKEAPKPDATEDVLAPPPGTEAPVKIAKVEPKKNGIRDLNLSLFNLRPAAIQQITINCQTDKGPTSWRVDTTDSQDWPIVVRRSGTEPSADLFLEPPPGDCFEKDFTIAVIYADGQNANTNAKADAHTKPDLAVDPKAPSVEPLGAWVFLTGDEKLFGKLEKIGPESVRITTPWQDHLDVPLARILGIHFCQLDRKETPESFAKKLKARGSEDQLLAQTKTGEVVVIPGILEGTEDDKLKFQYQGKTRTLPLKIVEGLVLGIAHGIGPVGRPADKLHIAFGSGRLGTMEGPRSGRLEGRNALGSGSETPGGGCPVRAIPERETDVSVRPDSQQGRGDPVFRPSAPWRRDVNLLGEPLKMNGQTYDHGVAVHSRSILTYDLNRPVYHVRSPARV